MGLIAVATGFLSPKDAVLQFVAAENVPNRL
jgi:hypothetical protein